jgi:hypothetical protein
MAGRAANLARELKTIKSELHFMQERCGLLEEENKRLRDGYDNGGAPPEEDDLVIIAYQPASETVEFLIFIQLKLHSLADVFMCNNFR